MTKGHLLEDGRWVFFKREDDVYRAPASAPIAVDGYAMGARWFCPLWQWRERQAQGVYPFEQRRFPTFGGASPIGPNPYGIPETALLYPDTSDA